jgi:phage terminase large subunit GpA-like protein
MREFAEQEITLPTGPYEGRRFNCLRQPFTRLLLDEEDRRDPVTGYLYWRRRNVTGPQQCGKSLLGFVIPILYHLFEVQETVVCGVPSLDTVSDKWFEDLLPVIERTRYRELLPLRGGGSRGGRVSSVRLRNGATLRFMTGGGSDKARASFTSRVLVVTETDDFAKAAETSLEADKLKQLEGRTKAYKDRAVVYQECTVTTKENPTWCYYEQGSASRILTPCPHCAAWVEMEREQLVGWQDAESEEAARLAAFWACPACGRQITEGERLDMNRRALLLHRGQEVTPEGKIVGSLPPTRTLGFRWSGFHNLFTDAAELAAEEWQGKNAADQENAEKALRQFRWCLPFQPELVEGAPLDPKIVAKRKDNLPHKLLPADTEKFVIGVDIGKWQSWYLCLCFRANKRIHIPDYGVIEVHSDALAEEVAILQALREFRETVEEGWPVEGISGNRVPDAVWIDAGHLPGVIHQFCRESGTFPGGRWMACIGRGASQVQKMKYNAPARMTNTIRRIGDRWFISRVREYQSWLVTIDADHYKLRLQHGLQIPPTDDAGKPQPGAITLYDPGTDKMMRDMHNKLSRHFASEQRQQMMEADKGLVETWVKHGPNHWLDCGMLGSAAGNYLGFRLAPSGEGSEPKAMTVMDWLKSRNSNAYHRR